MERSPLLAIIAHARLSSAFRREGFSKTQLFPRCWCQTPTATGKTSVLHSCPRNFLQRLHRGSGSAVVGSGFGDLKKQQQPKTVDPKERKKKRQRFFNQRPSPDPPQVESGSDVQDQKSPLKTGQPSPPSRVRSLSLSLPASASSSAA